MPWHALPHMPQLAASVIRFAHVAPHGVSPAPQSMHPPPVHTCISVHAVVQSPQCWRSVMTSTHEREQSINAAGQASMHMPSAQT